MKKKAATEVTVLPRVDAKTTKQAASNNNYAPRVVSVYISFPVFEWRMANENLFLAYPTQKQRKNHRPSFPPTKRSVPHF